MNLLSLKGDNVRLIIAFFLFALTFVVYYFTGEGSPSPFHYFVPLADAFLHGTLYLVDPPSWLNELVGINGKYYVIYPPMPAVLLLPQVAIWGLEANQTLTSVFWGSLNVALVFLLMGKLTDNRKSQIWMALLFGFGTVHWYLASIGKAWFFAQITSFFFLTLAVYETFTSRRLFLIGLLLGASFWCRLPTILSLPFFLIMLSDKWIKKTYESSVLRRIDFGAIVKVGIGVGIFVVLNLLYNYLRFGTVHDIAYSIQAEREPWNFPEGLFSLSYIPKKAWVFFLKPPIFKSEPPYIIPSLVGMSILITTPAFIYAIFAGIKNRVALACWSALIPIAFLQFTHGSTGWIQFGYRYAVDFYPFLLVLTWLGMKSTMGSKYSLGYTDLRWHHKLLISIGILVNLWGVLWINKFGWSSLWE
jgi:hypothetical protein